jgi:hypothetical protein
MHAVDSQSREVRKGFSCVLVPNSTAAPNPLALPRLQRRIDPPAKRERRDCARRLCANNLSSQENPMPHPTQLAGPLTLTLVLSLCSCTRPAPAEPTAAERQQVVARATAAIDPFRKKLGEALTSAMTQAGPVAAIEVCSQQAPRMAAEASTPELTVGRSALKLRNPANAPRAWLAPVLTELSALPSAEGAERVVRLEGSRFGYAQAITLKPPCVACHGTELAAPVAAKLQERYPKDEATGFEPGQLRGVFWAELALAR